MLIINAASMQRSETRNVFENHLETMKYEVRNKILSLKRSNCRNATDRVSVFRATGKLPAMPNSG